jgi:hypothetical protein
VPSNTGSPVVLTKSVNRHCVTFVAVAHGDVDDSNRRRQPQRGSERQTAAIL